MTAPDDDTLDADSLGAFGIFAEAWCLAFFAAGDTPRYTAAQMVEVGRHVDWTGYGMAHGLIRRYHTVDDSSVYGVCIGWDGANYVITGISLGPVRRRRVLAAISWYSRTFGTPRVITGWTNCLTVQNLTADAAGRTFYRPAGIGTLVDLAWTT